MNYNYHVLHEHVVRAEASARIESDPVEKIRKVERAAELRTEYRIQEANRERYVDTSTYGTSFHDDNDW